MLNQMHLEQVKRDQERELRHRIRVRRTDSRVQSRSVRRAVGRSIIEIGRRIAAEPQMSHPPRLARSR
jgi:hypothetical protein